MSRAMPELLAQTVCLALENADAGQHPFGALVVRNGEVLGTGVNATLRDSDPTAHAEVEAIRAACRRLGSPDLTGATVVSSCEPCPMCQAAATLVGVSRIVYAAPKEAAAEVGFQLGPAAAEMAFYRDILDLPVRMAWDESTGTGAILETGAGTLEIVSPEQANLIDEIEVGRRIAGPVRLALEVEDSAQTAAALVAGGAAELAPATETPWGI